MPLVSIDVHRGAATRTARVPDHWRLQVGVNVLLDDDLWWTVDVIRRGDETHADDSACR